MDLLQVANVASFELKDFDSRVVYSLDSVSLFKVLISSPFLVISDFALVYDSFLCSGINGFYTLIR
jgi:hypothetical protein